MADNIVFKESFVKNDISEKLSECISTMNESYGQNYEKFQTNSFITGGSYESQINNIYEVMGSKLKNEIKQSISELKTLGTEINEYYLKMINSASNVTLPTTTSIEKSSAGIILGGINTIDFNKYKRLSNEERDQCKGIAVIKRPDNPNRKPLSGNGKMTEEDWNGYEYLMPSLRCTGHDTDVVSACHCDGGFSEINKNTVKALDDLVVIAEQNNWDISVTSGYRCEDRLYEIGSPITSKHHAGLAFDVVMKNSDGYNISPQNVYDLVTTKIPSCDYLVGDSFNEGYTYNGGSFVHVQIKEDGSVVIEED